MTSIAVTVKEALAVAEVDGLLTSGMVGVKVSFTYDSAWDGLNKTAVFWAGSVMKDVLNVEAEKEYTVPHEVLLAPHRMLLIGVYGTNADGNVVIPTVWARADMIHPGTDPTGDESVDPTPAVWEQMQNDINELKKSGGGSGLPAITEKDEGAFLRVVNGEWAAEMLVDAEGVEY